MSCHLSSSARYVPDCDRTPFAILCDSPMRSPVAMRGSSMDRYGLRAYAMGGGRNSGACSCSAAGGLVEGGFGMV